MLRSLYGRTSNFVVLGRRMLSVESDFAKAQQDLKKLSEEPDTETKLKIYGLYKQGTTGNVSGSRPGMMDFAGRAKFDAWKSVEGLAKEDAQKKYADLVQSLLKADPAASAGDSGSSAAGGTGVPGLQITKEDQLFRITLNRPTKFNAITWEMYEAIIEALGEANKDRTTKMTVFTGIGDYYCSGNDLSNFTGIKSQEELKTMAENGEKLFHRYVTAFIDHNKPLVALVNGPAIGISVTLLALFDLVLASDKATFHTPFTSLGQSAEGCSTYTFPPLMGASKAAEMLLFGKKLTAQEAYDRNLVADVIPDARFRDETARRLKKLTELPPESLRINKTLLRDVHRAALHEVNTRECNVLKNRWLSAECAAALQKFMSRKN